MANWRRQGGEKNHQVGHFRSSSFKFNRKPPLDNRHSYSTVPEWEKKFCATVGLVPWGKLIECKKYMDLHSSVVDWDDSAGREAFYNAKRRFRAEINGVPCDTSLPDPDMYIDDVDWNSRVDPELLSDLEKARYDEEKSEVTSSHSQLQLQLQDICPTGWDIDEEEKPSDPLSAVVAQGWERNYDLHEDKGVDPWEQHFAPLEPVKEYDWQHCQNYSWGRNQREYYGGDSQNWGKGRGCGNSNWGAWDGYNRRRENMSWSKTNAHHGNNQMNRGRGNNRRRGRGSFGYADKVTTAWQVKT